MNYCGCCNYKGEQEVEGEEAGESSIVYRKAPSDSLDQVIPNVGNGG